MAGAGAIVQGKPHWPSLEAEEVEMIQDSRFPRVSVKAAPTPANMLSSSLRPQHNRPATIDEFEREHMGIAAKE